MNRTTILLPPSLKARAEAEARERGVSLAELIRQGLEKLLDTTGGPSDTLFADQVVFKGDAPADLAARHDDYLYGDKK